MNVRKIPAVKPIVSEPLKRVELDSLVAAFENEFRDQLEPIKDGSGHGLGGGEDGWIHGLSNVRLYEPLNELPWIFLEAIEQVRHPEQNIVQAMFNCMGPTGFLDRHVDGAPYYQRWHLGLIGSGKYQQDLTVGQHVWHQTPGNWLGPISYWVPHSVQAHAASERVVFLVDLEPVI